MKAVLETETITRIVLTLEEADQFSLPASTQPGQMTVTKLTWTVTGSADQSHPIDAKAVDENGIPWTLSLRMFDIPDSIQAELRKVLPKSDEDIDAEYQAGLTWEEKQDDETTEV